MRDRPPTEGPPARRMLCLPHVPTHRGARGRMTGPIRARSADDHGGPSDDPRRTWCSMVAGGTTARAVALHADGSAADHHVIHSSSPTYAIPLRDGGRPIVWWDAVSDPAHPVWAARCRRRGRRNGSDDHRPHGGGRGLAGRLGGGRGRSSKAGWRMASDAGRGCRRQAGSAERAVRTRAGLGRRRP